jgi:hypothetical protein
VSRAKVAELMRTTTHQGNYMVNAVRTIEPTYPARPSITLKDKRTLALPLLAIAQIR